MPSFQRNSIQRNPSRQNAYPVSNVNRAPLLSTSLAERGAISTMNTAPGRMAAPASSVS
jgi:hypothetical protein